MAVINGDTVRHHETSKQREIGCGMLVARGGKYQRRKWRGIKSWRCIKLEHFVTWRDIWRVASHQAAYEIKRDIINKRRHQYVNVSGIAAYLHNGGTCV